MCDSRFIGASSTACLCAVGAVAASSVRAAEQTAQPEPSTCPITRAAEPIEFHRSHQIPTRPAPDDPTHKMVTPGGMILHMPKMVAAVDLLRVEARDPSLMCFALTTVARDRHRCEIAGAAYHASSGTYVFREQDVEVHFKFQSENAVLVDPIGERYRQRCEPHGRIESAVFIRSQAVGDGR